MYINPFASVPVNEARLLLTPALADKVEQAYAARRGKPVPGSGARTALVSSEIAAISATPCREDGRCQYAIDHGAEGLGCCPVGKCAHMDSHPPTSPAATPRTDKFYDEVSDREHHDDGTDPNWKLPSKWSYEAILDLVDFARTLERECDELRGDIERHLGIISQNLAEIADLRGQLAQKTEHLRQQGEAYKELLEKAAPSATAATPVAWRVINKHGAVRGQYGYDPSADCVEGDTVQPLYAAPVDSQGTAARVEVAAIPEEVVKQQAALMHPATQVFFRAGLIACREYMARFVEAQDAGIAASIRANWWPNLGQDFGPPRLHGWAELTEGEYGTDSFRVKTADEVSPTQEALPIAAQFLEACSSPMKGQP